MRLPRVLELLELELADPIPGLPGEPTATEARWCEATIAGIRLASTYVPNGRALDSPEFPRKLAFLDAIAARVAALRKGPLVVAGDMNVAPADMTSTIPPRSPTQRT